MADTNHPSRYRVLKFAAKCWTTAFAAGAPVVWFYSHLSRYPYLFKSFGGSATDLVQIVPNVCAFTGKLFFLGVLMGGMLSAVYLRSRSVWFDAFIAADVAMMAVAFFMVGEQPPPSVGPKIFAALLITLVAVKWTPPLQAFFRKHVEFVAVLSLFFGVGAIVWVQAGLDDEPLFEAKEIAKFSALDWMSAILGMLVFVGAALLWTRLNKEDPPRNGGPQANRSDASGSRQACLGGAGAQEPFPCGIREEN